MYDVPSTFSIDSSSDYVRGWLCLRLWVKKEEYVAGSCDTVMNLRVPEKTGYF
jgi:hypothetical protein